VPGRPTEPDLDAATAAEALLLSMADEDWTKYTTDRQAEQATGAMYVDAEGRVRWSDPVFDRQVQEMVAAGNRGD